MMVPQVTLSIDLAEAVRAGHAVSACAAMHTRPEMLRSFSAALLEMVAVAQQERFQGKGPFPVAAKKLGVRTSRLWRSLHAEPARTVGNGITGKIGSNVEYFAAHELGFAGTVSVRAHLRKKQTVRAHTRKVIIPKREPLMAAIREHTSIIFHAAIARAAKSILATP